VSFAVQTTELQKKYPVSRGFRSLFTSGHRGRPIQALRGIDLHVHVGEIYGLLGPNGAGKTTLIKVLATLLHPDSGQALVFGMDVVRREREVKRRIGYVMGEERSFYWRLSGLDNLRFFAALDDLNGRKAETRIYEVLRLVGLETVARMPFRQYSTGMRQKLAIARALLTDPDLLLMDEPTRSLDPESSAVVRDLLKRLALEGRAVLFATHDLKEAEDVSTRIGVMVDGRIRAEGNPEDMGRWAETGTSLEICLDSSSPGTMDRIQALPEVLEVRGGERSGCFVVDVRSPEEVTPVIRSIVDSGASIGSMTRRERQLEAVFRSLLKEGE
jgi:ABC-2 type transport system ATP-binding protein